MAIKSKHGKQKPEKPTIQYDFMFISFILSMANDYNVFGYNQSHSINHKNNNKKKTISFFFFCTFNDVTFYLN